MKSNKYIYAFNTVCLGMLMLLSAGMASAQTSVVNGGFENGFTGWGADGTEPPVINSTTAHSGSFSADLICTNMSTNANTSIIEQNTFNSGGGTVNQGDIYNFSFWAQQISKDNNGYVQQYVVAFMDNNSDILQTTGYVPFTASTGTWTQITVNNLVAPSNAVAVYILISAQTGANANEYGEVLIDDVSLTLAGSLGAGETNAINSAIAAGTQVSWNATSPTATYQVQSSANSNTWSNVGGLVSGNTTTSLFVNVKAPYYQVLQINPGSGGGGGAISNGGFEIAGTAATNALDWTVPQAVGSPALWYGRTNDNPHSGSFEFEIHLAANFGQGPVVTLQQSGVPVTAGTTYPFTFYANELSGSAGAVPQWNVQWFGPGYLGQSGFANFTPGNNTYAYISNSITAPAGATTATVIIYVPGAADTNQTATILLDDVALGSGGSGTPGSTNTLSASASPGVQISWPTGAGTNYQVQSTATISDGGTPWANFGSAVAGTGSTNSVSDTANGKAKFYQVLQEIP